jgi:hypothetical protein
VTLEALAVGIDQLEEIVAAVKEWNAPPMQHRKVLADHHDGIHHRIGARQGRQDAPGRAIAGRERRLVFLGRGDDYRYSGESERANQVHPAKEERGCSIERLGRKMD